MALTPEESTIEKNALAFARRHKKSIAKKLTDKKRFTSEEKPVSVFMAGSPGAGKTEASKELLADKYEGVEIVRIDPDELRHEFDDYNGANSWLFQPAVSVLVDKVHDLVLDQQQSFLLDGTLCRYDKAEKNIERSLKKGRTVQILYVYQEPALAWNFVKSREVVERRRIKREHFIEQYFKAREAVNQLKRHFGTKIKVDLLIKNTDNTSRTYKAGIDQIDNHVPEKYTPGDLKKLLEPDQAH